MKSVRMLLPVILLAITVMHGQNSTRFLLVNMQRTYTSPLNRHGIADCILVRADGSFHREHQSRDLSETKRTDVYEGRLTPASLEQLDAVLDSDAFRKQGQTFRIGYLSGTSGAPPALENEQVPYAEKLTVNVIRISGSQNINVEEDDARRPREKALEPLMRWWEAIEKIKLPNIKGAQATGCQISADDMEEVLIRARRRQQPQP